MLSKKLIKTGQNWLRSFHASSLVYAESQKSTSPKKTILYDFHVSEGGKIVDFAGFLMPVQYKDQSIQESHLFTRSNCSLFDVSHMMQTKVYGKDRFRFIESLIVSDIRGLKPDSGSLTVFTNENGGIIDDLIVANTSKDYLFIVSNAGCAEKDFAHMKQKELEMKGEFDVRLERIEDRGLLALQGPRMQELLQTGVNFDLKKFPFMSTTEATVFGIEDCRVTRCGYTGEDGVEISVPAKHATDLASILTKNRDICRLAGLGPRDTLRLEAGLCLYGNDIDDTTTPVEAGLAWTISKRRREEKNFPGASIILKQLKEKPLKRRVGLVMTGKTGPSARQHAKIMDNTNEMVGEVTSGCLSPQLKQNISMGYVRSDLAATGTKLLIDVRNKKYEFQVVKMPFVPTRYFTKVL